MGFTLDMNISAITVFLQGILSFFSPCVLPLIPLYVGYLSGGTMRRDENGNMTVQKSKVIGNTFCFVLGISFTFIILGLGVSTLSNFLSRYQVWITRIGGVFIILLGLYQTGIFGSSKILGNTHRLPFRTDGLTMSPVTAFLMGFTFSFGWTPCVGPVLTSVLFMTASAANKFTGLLLILVYTLGFVLPFMLVGLFTTSVLKFFKNHMQVVKYTTKIGGIIMILVGALMLAGTWGELSKDSANEAIVSENENSQQDENQVKDETDQAPDFTLTDQYGNTHTLSDYKGKVVFINFWATWCSPCKQELPHIQSLFEEYNQNQESDVIILGITAPKYGNEKTVEGITGFLEANGYTFPVLMDTTASVFQNYGISAFPTTFMIDRDGKVYGYITGQLSEEMMHSIIEQTMTGQ